MVARRALQDAIVLFLHLGVVIRVCPFCVNSPICKLMISAFFGMYKYLCLKTKDYILGGCTVTHQRFLLTASLLLVGSGVENEESLIKQTDL